MQTGYGEQIIITKLPMTNIVSTIVLAGLLVGSCALIVAFFIALVKLKRSRNEGFKREVEETIKELERYVNREVEMPNKKEKE